MKFIKTNIVISILLILVMLIIPVNSYAKSGASGKLPDDSAGKTNPIVNPLENPGEYKPSGKGSDLIEAKKASIVNIGTSIGIVVSVIAIIILGIKYIIGSAEQRSDYKKTMVPMAIGMIFIALISTVIRILSEVSGAAFG